MEILRKVKKTHDSAMATNRKVYSQVADTTQAFSKAHKKLLKTIKTAFTTSR